MLPTIWFYLALAAAAAASAAAEEDAFNDTTWTIQEYECESYCGSGMFCGRDLQCYPYSCETFYALGHPSWTGHDDDPSLPPPPKLDCQIVEPGQDRSFLHAMAETCPRPSMVMVVLGVAMQMHRRTRTCLST
jgi:uncharacterized protein YuzB (UPF0349 family)